MPSHLHRSVLGMLLVVGLGMACGVPAQAGPGAPVPGMGAQPGEPAGRIRLALAMRPVPAQRAWGQPAAGLLQTLDQSVSDKLVASRKFTVLDRAQREKAWRDFQHIAADAAPDRRGERRPPPARLAHFLVEIEVSGLPADRQEHAAEHAWTSARARVYDAVSGYMVHSVAASAQRVRDSSVLASRLGAELAVQIIDQVFPTRVVAMEGGNPVINAGAGLFEVGDRVGVWRQGRPLQDPYTRESLGFAETLVGHGVVVTVLPRVSVVQLAPPARLPDATGHRLVVRRSRAPVLHVPWVPVPLVPPPLLEALTPPWRERSHDDW